MSNREGRQELQLEGARAWRRTVNHSRAEGRLLIVSRRRASAIAASSSSTTIAAGSATANQEEEPTTSEILSSRLRLLGCSSPSGSRAGCDGTPTP